MKIFALSCLFVGGSLAEEEWTVFGGDTTFDDEAEAPRCVYDAATGRTTIHYDAAFHHGFKCEHSDTSPPTCTCHTDGATPQDHPSLSSTCKEFNGSHGGEFKQIGDCSIPDVNCVETEIAGTCVTGMTVEGVACGSGTQSVTYTVQTPASGTGTPCSTPTTRACSLGDCTDKCGMIDVPASKWLNVVTSASSEGTQPTNNGKWNNAFNGLDGYYTAQDNWSNDAQVTADLDELDFVVTHVRIASIAHGMGGQKWKFSTKARTASSDYILGGEFGQSELFTKDSLPSKWVPLHNQGGATASVKVQCGGSGCQSGPWMGGFQFRGYYTAKMTFLSKAMLNDNPYTPSDFTYHAGGIWNTDNLWSGQWHTDSAGQSSAATAEIKDQAYTVVGYRTPYVAHATSQRYRFDIEQEGESFFTTVAEGKLDGGATTFPVTQATGGTSFTWFPKALNGDTTKQVRISEVQGTSGPWRGAVQLAGTCPCKPGVGYTCGSMGGAARWTDNWMWAASGQSCTDRCVQAGMVCDSASEAQMDAVTDVNKFHQFLSGKYGGGIGSSIYGNGCDGLVPAQCNGPLGQGIGKFGSNCNGCTHYGKDSEPASSSEDYLPYFAQVSNTGSGRTCKCQWNENSQGSSTCSGAAAGVNRLCYCSL